MKETSSSVISAIRMESFDLCEECYDKLIEGFTVEVTKEEVQELL